jgi:hypothetical protein
MAFAAQASLVNGDFSSTTINNNGQTSFAFQESDVNAGWFQSNLRTEWGVVGGKLKRNYTSAANAGYCVGQIFDDNLTAGTYSLQFDYDLINTDTSGNVMVQVYLYDSLTGADLVYTDRLDLSNSGGTTPTDTAAWDKTLLGAEDLMLTANGNYTGHTINFTLPSDMGEKDRIAIRIYSLSLGSSTGTLQFDNFEITTPSIPATPTNLSATVVSAYAIDLGWSDTSSSEDGFIIERGADTNSLVAIATNAANDATYSDTGLSPTTEYWYRVSAHNGAGSSTNNPVASATTDSLTGPTAPTSLSATAVGTDAIDLTWTDTSDVEDGFIIERGADTNSLAAIATNAVNDTTYSDTGLTPSTEYWYRVSTYNGIGASTGNPTAAATTLTPSGLGTVFSDDFTGADNTAITTTDWGYMDLGVEVVPGGSVVPRTAPAADIFEIRGNELYAEITPLETADSATYNKVMAAIYPESGGSPVYATIASGEKVVFEADLTDYVNNLGNMWGLNQQLKLVLSKRAGTYTDPHQAAADTNYVLIVTVHQSDNANQISVQGTYNRAGTQIATPSVNFTNSAALPLHLTMEHYSSGTTAYLVNGTLVGMLSGTALPTVHPYIWLGKFNGGGAELTAGSVTLDNVGITLADAGSAPDAASGFAASSPASGTIGLSWTDVATTELGYRLERKAGAAAYAEIAVLAANANSYTDTGLLSDGTIYGYRLTAFNGAGDSTGVETSATASSNPFVNWALSYPVLSGSKANTADYDNDGASDYREYALNGNPTNGADTGMVEATTDGTILTYIYAKRTDDNTIVYTLVDTTDLLFGQQFTNNWDGQTVGPSGVANFDSVTNTYNMTGSQRFIKLIIE